MDEHEFVILKAVDEAPGISFRAIARRTGVPTWRLRDYLDRLIADGSLAQESDGAFLRFFRSSQVAKGDRRLCMLIQRDAERRILLELLKQPATRAELRRALQCGDSTLGFHLARLVRYGVVFKLREGAGKTKYAVENPGALKGVLRIQKPPGGSG